MTKEAFQRFLPVLIVLAGLLGIWLGATIFAALT
jgi:hypothetical protein